MKESTFRVAQVAFMIVVVVLFGIVIAMLGKPQQPLVIIKDEPQSKGESKDEEVKAQDIIAIESDKSVGQLGFQYKKELSDSDEKS